jgi:hypothetical protein
MRRASLVIVIVLIACTLMTELARAQVGCCMTRRTADPSTPWVQFGTDLDECKRLNSNENDNILEPLGKVWWSIKC